MARGPLRHRAGHRGRLLLRLRTAGRRALHRRGPRPDRRRDAGHHGRGPAVRPPRALHRRGSRALRRPALQARDHRGGGSRPGRGRRRGRRAAGGQGCPRTGTPRRSPTCAGARTCPPRARSDTSPSCGWPAPTGGATRSASSSSGSTGRPGSPRRPWPTTCTAWRRPRSATTAARCRAGPLQLPRRDRLGPGRLPPQGRHRPQGHGGLQPPAPRDGRLRVRLHAAHDQSRAVRDVGPPRLVLPSGMYPPMELDGGTSTT